MAQSAGRATCRWDPSGADGTVVRVKAIRRFTVRTVLPAALAPLAELALNLRWSWHADSQELFAASTRGLGRGRSATRCACSARWARSGWPRSPRTRDVVRRVQEAADDLHAYLTEDRWYQHLQREAGSAEVDAVPPPIAYFSPEFGITAVLPQYSGGLGILAGDHLKAASDLGVPIIGVGLLYRAGYFRSRCPATAGSRSATRCSTRTGCRSRCCATRTASRSRSRVGLPGGRQLVAQVWKAQVGRVPLLLLDSDVEDNEPAERDVTDRLYGGGSEHRLLQEMLLGIGGVRALRAYAALTGTPAPEVFHTNEGHAGFLGIERIRELTEDAGLTFDEALEAVRAGNVFTTHTPVPAGIDRFPRDLVAQHFGGDNGCPGVPVDRVLALGAEDYEGGDPSVFNMAVMGLRLAQRANGVSKLHGEVARGMFAGLWPGFDAAEVPISLVTNGVHAPTWVAPEVLRPGRDRGRA